MKKIGIIIFIIALFIGVIFANIFSFGQTSARFFNFSFSFKEKGSGNVVKERRDVSEFKQVDVSAIQVEITAQKDFSVEVEADDNLLPLVRTEVRGGVLRIETNGRYKSRNPIIVRVSAPNIEDLDVSGASKVSLTNLSNENFAIHSSGASKIKVEGTTANLEIKTSGASKINAENLKAENVSVDASGASHATVSVSGDLKVNASGASNVSYTGTPTNFDKKTSGASNVKQK
jgi:hypothetical protein